MDLGSIIATVTTVALGVTLVWGKAEKVLKALKELGDVLTAIVKSLEDQKLTVEEIAEIKKEAAEALSAFKAILK